MSVLGFIVLELNPDTVHREPSAFLALERVVPIRWEFVADRPNSRGVFFVKGFAHVA